MTRFCCCFCFVVLLTLMVGCNKNVGLRGKITFSDDDSPVTAGTIAFRKDGRIARGDIKEDGTYIVGFEKESNGLPPGKYEVYITGTDKVTTTLLNKEMETYDYQYEPQLDKKYEDPLTSGITLEVTASTKVFDFKVDRFPKR